MTFLVSTGEADESDEDVDLAVEVMLGYRESRVVGLVTAFSFAICSSARNKWVSFFVIFHFLTLYFVVICYLEYLARNSISLVFLKFLEL